VAAQIGPAAAGGLAVRAEGLQRPLDATPLRVAEAAAEARRRWQRTVDGPLYVHLINQVFRLGNERRRHEKQRHKKPHLAHWEETEAAARQRGLGALRRAFEALRGEIIALEDAALQALLGEATAVPVLAPWEARFLALQQEVFHAMRPESGLCTLGVYAPRPLLDEVVAAWADLAGLAGMTLRRQVVWLRDPAKALPWHKGAAGKPAPQAPASSRGDEDGDEDGDGDKADDDAKPEPVLYDKEDWPLPAGKVLPPKALVVGFELELRGPAVFDYLRSEGGLWRFWQGERKSDAWVVLRNQALEAFATPREVHRRRFFEAVPVHRQVKLGQLSDAAGGWRVDWPHAPLWKALLDRHFSRTMDRMLQGLDDDDEGGRAT
jgi:hypothetical protein